MRHVMGMVERSIKNSALTLPSLLQFEFARGRFPKQLLLGADGIKIPTGNFLQVNLRELSQG